MKQLRNLTDGTLAKFNAGKNILCKLCGRVGDKKMKEGKKALLNFGKRGDAQKVSLVTKQNCTN